MEQLIPKFYSKLIDWNNPTDPLLKMVKKDNCENIVMDYEVSDPIGDKPKTVIPGLIHRYPDRVLLNLTQYCAIHCRFCFRKNLLTGKIPKIDLKKIFSYLKSHKEIWEVILSGGDPLIMKPEFLKKIIKEINKITHVKTLRIHTRIPVVDPTIISKNSLIQLFEKSLSRDKKLVIVVHVNHAKEITKEFQTVVKKFQKIGAIILSQSVLLKDVNNDPKTLTELFRKLIESGVKPYYLHHLDPAKGTHHFRVSIEEGKKIFSSLRGNLSGICLPEYMVEIPGGLGKIPVQWLKKTSPKIYTAKNFEGKDVKYIDFA